MTDMTPATQGPARELVAFRIGAQEFAIDITQVREIRGWAPETALPHAPLYVRGVINLRGAVLPILDLATRLGLPPARPTVRHVIIVVQVGPRLLGLLVDAVSDIQPAPDDHIRPTPDLGPDTAKPFVRGILPAQNRMILLLTLDDILPHTNHPPLAA